MAVDGFLVILDQDNQPVQSENQSDYSRVFGPTGQQYPSGQTFVGLPAAVADSRNAFEIEDFSFDTHTNTGAGTAASSKVTFDPLALTMRVDKATPVFFQDLAAGRRFNSAALVLLKSSGGTTSGVAYCVFGFGTVLAHTFAVSYDDESPKLALSFTYRQAQIAYRQQKPDGSFFPWFEEGWDRDANAAI
jgi:type VI protein secretion system component Hcp